MSPRQNPYRDHKGKRYDRVSAALDKGYAKPGLKRWGEGMVAQCAFDRLNQWQGMTRQEAVEWLKGAPWRDTERAMIKGSDIHHWAERYVLGQKLVVDEAPPEQQGYLKGFLSFLSEWKPDYEFTEAVGFNAHWGYTGTLDVGARIADLGEGMGVIDYKTGRSGAFPEHALQCSAYANMEFLAMPDGSEVPMPEVEWGAVLWLKPDGYELIPVDISEETFRTFLYVLQQYRFQKDNSVIGNTLVAPCYRGEPRPTYPPNVSLMVD